MHRGEDLARLIGRVLKRNALLRTVAAALSLISPEPSPPHEPTVLECSSSSASRRRCA
jgi:hypothetical protein